MKKVILKICALLCAVAIIIGMCSVFAMAISNPVYVGWTSKGEMDVERKTMDTDISCMTFNVLHFNESSVHEYGDGSYSNRLKYAVKMIKTYSPDIVGIQEAGNKTGNAAGTGIDWPTDLKNNLGDEYGYIQLTDQPTAKLNGRNYMYITSGLMIFYKKSRLSVVSHDAVPFLSEASTCGEDNCLDRWYQWAKLKISDENDPNYGQIVYMFNTHLATNHLSSNCPTCAANGNNAERGKYWRTYEMNKLANKINELSANYPCFVTGDFNCTFKVTLDNEEREDTTYRQLYALIDQYPYMQSALTTADLQTNSSGANCIDHVFYNTRYLHCKKLSRVYENDNYDSGSTTPKGYTGSDHYPYIAYCKLTPDITITSSTGTGEYDPFNFTFTDVANSDKYAFTFPSLSGITYETYKIDELAQTATQINGTSPFYIVRHKNKYRIDIKLNGTLFASVDATIYNYYEPYFARLPKLQTQGAVNHYFANHAYHVVVDKNTTEAIVTPSCPNLVEAGIYTDALCTKQITDNHITNIQPGKTTYYIKKTFYNGDANKTVNHTEPIPLYVYRETAEPYMGRAANTDGTRRVLYIDQNIGSATGTVAFWDGKDVRLVDGQVNAFDALADVNSKLTTYSNYEVYMASGTYKASTATYKHAVHFFGVNHDESPNKRILEGAWELVDRGEETIIDGQIKIRITDTWDVKPVTIHGFTFTGQTKEGSLFIEDISTKINSIIQLDIQNNLFLGWGMSSTAQSSTADILAAGTKGSIAGLIANNYFAREVGRTATLDMTNYPDIQNRAIHMRNVNGLVIDSNRFVDYDKNTFYFTSERINRAQNAGYLNLTVQDNRFENCVSTEHWITNIDDTTKASINYFGNYFLRCGYGTAIILVNVTENGLVEKTNFANCSINIQSNKFYECERAIGLYRNNKREYDTTTYSAFGGDISELTFNINQNVFWIPPERPKQVGNQMTSATQPSHYRWSYNSYSLSCIYFRVANENKSPAAIPSGWNFTNNAFYAKRLASEYKNPYHPSLYINCYMKQDWVSGSPTVGYESFDESALAQKFIPYSTSHACNNVCTINSTSTSATTSSMSTLSGITATGFTGAYDGKGHSITVNNVPDNAFVSYSYGDPADNGYKCYSATNPEFKDVGTYTVTYRVTQPGLQPYYNSATVTITKLSKNSRVAAIENKSATYQYNTSHQLDEYPTASLLEGDSVSYIYEKARYDSMPSFSTVGIYTVKVEITNPNCETYTFTPKLTINPASLSDVTISAGYEGEYDGTSRTIMFQSLPLDVVPLYSIDGGEFVTTKPSFKDVTDGPVTVTVRLANPNYSSYADQTFTYNITPMAITDVTVAAKTDLVEDGHVKELVTVSGTQTNDTVQYALNGGPYSDAVPTALRAGVYTVAVKISRENCANLVQVVTVTVGEGTTTVPNMFTLTLKSIEVTATDTGITTFSWQLGFAEAQIETLAVVESADFKVLSYGLKYAATLNHLEDYVFYKKYGKETEAQALITAKNVADHPYQDFGGTGIATLYARNNMHISNTNPNKARYAVSYIRFSIDGVEYEEYSHIASASNLPGSDFSDYGDIPTTDGAINESDIFTNP